MKQYRLHNLLYAAVVLASVPSIRLIQQTFSAHDKSVVVWNISEYIAEIADSINVEVASTYVRKYGKTAIEEQQLFGVPASIKIAQGMLESNYGRCTAATKYNCHFNIKAVKGTPYSSGTFLQADENKFARFHAYQSSWWSFRHHSKFVTSGKYKYISGDYKKWAKGLKRAGYATDKDYANKLIKIIEQYQLYKLDKIAEMVVAKEV
ncbi:MAG: glucosaminidase domain-containing protein [Saprospiraceae bacterium]